MKSFSRITSNESRTEQTSDFSNVPFKGMIQERSQTSANAQQPDLKTSLLQAERYGHNLSQMQATSFTAPTATQPKMEMRHSMKSEGTKEQLMEQGVVQRMNDDSSIGERIAGRRRFDRLTSRQQTLQGDPENGLGRNVGRTSYFERPDSNLWDGSTRPGFDESTWNSMLASVSSRQRADGVMEYQSQISNNYFPRKRNRSGQEKYITLDHITEWKKYILENARPEADGQISKQAAKKAYNDLKNLMLMSNAENSSKNGSQGVFD